MYDVYKNNSYKKAIKRRYKHVKKINIKVSIEGTSLFHTYRFQKDDEGDIWDDDTVLTSD